MVKGVDITIDGEKKTAVSDGLVWMGLPPVNPKVTVYRPQGGYAKWWEEKTEDAWAKQRLISVSSITSGG